MSFLKNFYNNLVKSNILTSVTQSTLTTNTTDEIKESTNMQIAATDASDFLQTIPSSNGYLENAIVENDSEFLRVKDRRLVDYSSYYAKSLLVIMSNKQINLEQYSANYQFKVELKYKKSTTTGIILQDISEYVLSIEEYCYYTDQIMSFLKVKLSLPEWIYIDILQKINESRELNAIEFYLKISKYKHQHGNVQGESLFFDAPEFNSGYFQSNPYYNTPLIPIDNANRLTEQFNFSNIIGSDSERDSTTLYTLELDLFSKFAIEACKKTFDLQNSNITSVNDLITGLINEIKESTNNGLTDENIYYSPIHNKNALVSLSIEKLDLNELVSYIDNIFGLYTFGTKIFFTGNNLFFGDNEIEEHPKLKSMKRMIITVYPNATNANLAVNGLIFYNDTIYCCVPESSVEIKDLSSSALEIYGDKIILSGKSGSTNLLFPRNMIKRNISQNKDPITIIENSSEKTKIYKKENDSVFFETRFLHAYNRETGYIEIILENIDPDYFYFGKHIYLNFINPNFIDLYSDEYVVANKTVSYEFGGKKVTGNRIKIRLRKVINEIPYNYSQQLEVIPIYHEATLFDEKGQLVEKGLELGTGLVPKSYPTGNITGNAAYNGILRVSPIPSGRIAMSHEQWFSQIPSPNLYLKERNSAQINLNKSFSLKYVLPLIIGFFGDNSYKTDKLLYAMFSNESYAEKVPKPYTSFVRNNSNGSFHNFGLAFDFQFDGYGGKPDYVTNSVQMIVNAYLAGRFPRWTEICQEYNPPHLHIAFQPNNLECKVLIQAKNTREWVKCYRISENKQIIVQYDKSGQYGGINQFLYTSDYQPSTTNTPIS